MESQLFNLIQTGSLQRVEALLRANTNVDVNHHNSAGQTPLYWAAECDTSGIAELLISKGARLDIAENFGFTPLHLASFLGKTATVELFLKHNANPNIKNKSGSTPLHLACKNGHLGSVKLLLGAGADILAIDKKGNTALHYTRDRGIRELIEATVKLNVRRMNELLGIKDKNRTETPRERKLFKVVGLLQAKLKVADESKVALINQLNKDKQKEIDTLKALHAENMRLLRGKGHREMEQIQLLHQREMDSISTSQADVPHQNLEALCGAELAETLAGLLGEGLFVPVVQ